jgi:hypothetical protein
MKRKDVRDLGVDGRKILKWNKQGLTVLTILSGSLGVWKSLAESYVHGNVPPGS